MCPRCGRNTFVVRVWFHLTRCRVFFRAASRTHCFRLFRSSPLFCRRLMFSRASCRVCALGAAMPSSAVASARRISHLIFFAAVGFSHLCGSRWFVREAVFVDRGATLCRMGIGVAWRHFHQGRQTHRGRPRRTRDSVRRWRSGAQN